MYKLTQAPDLRTALQLLETDGSTTFMLESIVQTELHVRVFQQELVSVRDLPTNLDWHVLSLAPDSTVLFRHSGLFTEDGVQVSENLVVANVSTVDDVETLLWEGNIPIIKILEQAKPDSARTILGYGKKQAAFAGQDTFLCYKHYYIHADDDPFMYIHEVFAPWLISLEQ